MPRRRQRKRQRTFDDEITLVGEKLTYDELKNPIIEEIRNPILCDVESVGSNEFYDASAQGLKPSKTFVVHLFEYNGEQVVEFEDKNAVVDRYKVIRTYTNDYEEIELTCEKVIGNG